MGLCSKRSNRKQGFVRLSICSPPKVMLVDFLYVFYAHLSYAEAPSFIDSINLSSIPECC